ncbi:D-malate degradation protein R [Hartmannibacter diazotrophicus]|uniref:D-malate degradation protein R n=1 Tax=Hartmannibacter diazotrophicus TaxID=1482074 RepID=A0A2C9D9A7_9HYPH|nr:LysR family transcriptional regulator [Hartmannibacter diazotrophicus]SON56813.1 D-malate degradation protein R [Hartmannibacter diazotrophicus]
MDRIDDMRLFIRVVETRSFRGAARDLGLPASTVTDAVKRMEARLGVRLLERTTRVVAPTLDGEAWYRRSLRIVSEMEDAEAAFRSGPPKGRLHVNAHGTLARHFLIPRLPDFLERYPEIDLLFSEGDRIVDLVREGVDCVVRAGIPADSDLIARRLGTLAEITVASPDYLARHGVPKHPDDLDGHRMVGFLSSRTGAPLPLEFDLGERVIERRLPVSVMFTAAESMVAAARLGLGLIQVPRYRLDADLKAGTLVEVLASTPPTPTPVSALYPRDRQLSPRVRVFLDWLREIDFAAAG